ncbi:SHQ1-domain-containing protein [Metschnikowia bicuspidata]|uniref:SHQ1-domain-containing protein n=1 Tax=Metschnikowia bicuspidata TaxID=27322 RepID=A0A4P9ZAJ3_9ASCO|nr:SHQ1-domain-containing protein [Metschnikowia bicuspidata]
MLTPYFKVTQDNEYIYLSIRILHARFSAQALEMVVDSEVFIFSLSPYYLRLRFPHPLVDDERAVAMFNSKESTVEVKLPKENRGQDFPDLDLAASLLARKDEPQAGSKPLIEELDVPRSVDTNFEATTANLVHEGESYDWELPQNVAEEPKVGVRYGFNNAYSSIVGVSLTNGNDINELGDPECALPNDRIVERLIKENIKFDPEFYAADYIMHKHPSHDDDKSFVAVLAWKSPVTRQFVSWYNQQKEVPVESCEHVVPLGFTEKEQQKMMQLPRKSYLIDEPYKMQLYVLILSVLFAYNYDLRENQGEHNVESAWTVGKLIPQFAFLDSQLSIASENSHSILKACVITGVRRALCYPLYRNYAMAAKAWNDVYYILRSGKRVVMQSLLAARELFRFHDVYYVYDKIWLEDLCLWVLSDAVIEVSLRQVAHDLKKELDALKKTDITFEKIDETQSGEAMMVLDVEEIEAFADESYAEYSAQN